MRLNIAKYGLILLLLLLFRGVQASEPQGIHEEKAEGFNLKEMIFSHVTDAYDWHLLTVKGHHYSIPLPIIVKSESGEWAVFMSSRLAHGETYKGFSISHSEKYNNKVVEINAAGEEVRPLDLSFTKNAASLMLSVLLMLTLFLSLARSYKKEPVKARKGFAGMIEVVVVFVQEGLIKPCVGPEYKRFSPYLLTAFFFILINNLLGLVPFFPGGANVTGNISITLVLALCTFAITNLCGNKAYWKEVLWPDVPLWLKVPIPIMPFVELLGVFTKPFALMIRLFANMLAGHMIILVLMGLIFIFSYMIGPAVGAGVSVISIAFSIFMLALDILVSFIQAYVFTMLSAIFIGMGRMEHEHKEAH